MGRTYSPSPPTKRRERERTERKKRRERRSRERELERERDTRRRRSRDREERSLSREDRRFSRSRSDSRDREHASTSRGTKSQRPQYNVTDLAGKSPEEVEMIKTMGFCNFDTTKNKKVDGNDVGQVHVILKRKYRQYMNRKGGFNRPLDFVA